MKINPVSRHAFTLVELLTVIAIIAVLMGLLFPTVGAVRDSARRAQAQHDVTQIATAIRAFYTEYGRYPSPAGSTPNQDTEILGSSNASMMDILRGIDTTVNPRRIPFFEGTEAKEPGRHGIQPTGETNAGVFLDPWGTGYSILMDTNYDNVLAKPDSELPGPTELRTGVAVWTEGKPDADKPVVSWQ